MRVGPWVHFIPRSNNNRFSADAQLSSPCLRTKTPARYYTTMEFMHKIFSPRSLVVIGVSERPDNLARFIIANLRAFGYKGDLYAVGRQPGKVYDIPIVASLDEIPDGLDLAVILTPAETVPALADRCGRKGIKQIVIESGGFSEFSERGRQLEEELKEIAKRWGIRFVGPNCISVVNLEAGLCLPFAPINPQSARRGSASVISQSGGISITYLDKLSASGVGVSTVISIGNKTDLDETDYLEYLLADPETKILCLYLESISDGRRLLELARSSQKPIIVHKANRSQASQSIAFSHTAALASDDRIVEGAFRQAGIVRAESFNEAVAQAQGLTLPPVRGDTLVIISRSGGHAVVAADAAERYGFRLAELPHDFTEKIRALSRADVIRPTNPIDLGTIFDFDLYAHIVEECLKILTPDAVVLINTYSALEAKRARTLAHRVQDIMKESHTPIALCVFAQGNEAQELQRELSIPVFTEIESAMCGLAASRSWHQRRQRPTAFPVPSGRAPLALSEEGILTADRALQLCQEYGISVAPWEAVETAEAAVRAAENLGYPVALKILSSEIAHKTDVGGVVLDLSSPESVRRSAQALFGRFSARLIVQRMIPEGLELIVGGKRDRTFGPVVMIGLGGIFTEILDDVAFRVAPLTPEDIEEMLTELRGQALFEGVRGRGPIDRAALVQTVLAISHLITEHKQIAEFEINPLLALPSGVWAVDARGVIGS
ncbi:MAG: acetate--CoA ligase family protein [Candidatus Bipolaricaulota bacterium]|nr:acetate--CoA ligase family protein [Candidatus Bipolaricaulota bacterium]